MKKLVIITLFAFTVDAFALSSFWVGTGTTTHNFLSAQKSTSGNKKIIELAPTILAGAIMPFIFSGMSFAPGVGYAKFFTKDNTTKSEFILQLHFTHTPTSIFQFRYGFSSFITKIGGDGSSVVLNNGSSTATFYAPQTTTISYTASLDLAGDLIFTSNWTARMQFSIMRFLSSSRRRVSNLITVNYYF